MRRTAKPRIIGLAGQAGAGKDFTFLAWLDAGWPVARASFADALRREISETLGGHPDAYLHPLYEKPMHPDVRALLQWWGTDLRRRRDPDYWVRKGIDWARQVMEGGRLWPVITDVRFHNEAEAIRSAGGLVVKVSRPELIRAKALGYDLTDPADCVAFDALSAHPSEKEAALIRGDVYLLPGHGKDEAIALGRRLWGPEPVASADMFPLYDEDLSSLDRVGW